MTERKPLKKIACVKRVSSELQARKGDSLDVQHDILQAAVDQLKGEAIWYGGQEHATPGWERKELDRLMGDAKAGKIDAVMVADLSRWSRNNLRSRQDLEVLKELRIRFFIGTAEQDLHDPQTTLFIGLGTEINEFVAKQNTKKSLATRIKRAKEGKPTTGRKPYGRWYNYETNQWEFNQKKKELLEQIAQEYLETNIGFERLSKKYGFKSWSHLRITLLRAGDTWLQSFKKGKIIVPTKVHELLKPEVIEAIKKKAKKNLTYDRGNQKHKYLLSKLVRLIDKEQKKGYAPLTGTCRRNWRSYQTFKKPGKSYRIPAEILEDMVLYLFQEMLNNQENFLDAVYNGHNSSQKLAEELLAKKAAHEKNLTRLEANYKRITNRMMDLDDDEYARAIDNYKAKLRSLDAQIKECHEKINDLSCQLENLPREDELEQLRQRILGTPYHNKMSIKEKMDSPQGRLHAHKSGIHGLLTSGFILKELPYDELRDFMIMVFGGKDPQGRKYGIYLTPGKARGEFSIELFGRLGSHYGDIPYKEFPDHPIIADPKYRQAARNRAQEPPQESAHPEIIEKISHRLGKTVKELEKEAVKTTYSLYTPRTTPAAEPPRRRSFRRNSHGLPSWVTAWLV